MYLSWRNIDYPPVNDIFNVLSLYTSPISIRVRELSKMRGSKAFLPILYQPSTFTRKSSGDHQARRRKEETPFFFLFFLRPRDMGLADPGSPGKNPYAVIRSQLASGLFRCAGEVHV
jgi:hypothetical protein